MIDIINLSYKMCIRDRYIHAKEVINLRGSVIPLIRLRDILDVPGEQEESDTITVVIVRKGDKLAGLVVDRLIGQMEIVIKSLGKYININRMTVSYTHLDYLAFQIKDKAKEYNIAIVENKPLARILYHNIDVGMEIPPELYQAVAEILAAVMKTNNRL